MNPARPGPQHPGGVPTLTEVIELPVSVAPQADLADAASAEPGLADSMLPTGETDGDVAETAGLNEALIVQHVLADLQRHAELMLEYRLREALAPALARCTDQLIGELRNELAATLRDVVARAVSQELARRRFR